MHPDGCFEHRFVRWVVKEHVTGIDIVTIYLCHLVTVDANNGKPFDSLSEVDEMYIRAHGIRTRHSLPWGLVVPEAWRAVMPLRDQLTLLRRPHVALVALQYAIRDLRSACTGPRMELRRRIEDVTLPLLETVTYPPLFQLLNSCE